MQSSNCRRGSCMDAKGAELGSRPLRVASMAAAAKAFSRQNTKCGDPRGSCRLHRTTRSRLTPSSHRPRNLSSPARALTLCPAVSSPHTFCLPLLRWGAIYKSGGRRDRIVMRIQKMTNCFGTNNNSRLTTITVNKGERTIILLLPKKNEEPRTNLLRLVRFFHGSNVFGLRTKERTNE